MSHPDSSSHPIDKPVQREDAPPTTTITDPEVPITLPQSPTASTEAATTAADATAAAVLSTSGETQPPPSPVDAISIGDRLVIKSLPSNKRSSKAIVPCYNFSMVYKDVFRSAHPNPRNKEFIKEYLQLKTIVCFCYEDHKQGKYPKEMVAFYEACGIKLLFVYLEHVNEPFAFPTHHSVISRVLSVVMNVQSHPVLMHCEDGNHQTGLVCACLRKAQQWSLSSIYAEFSLFNGGRHNLMVQQFVDLYRPVVVTSNPTALASWMLTSYDFQYVASPSSTPTTTTSTKTKTKAVDVVATGGQTKTGGDGYTEKETLDVPPKPEVPPPTLPSPLYAYELEALQRFYETSAITCNPGVVCSNAPLQIIVVLPLHTASILASGEQDDDPTSSGFGSTACINYMAANTPPHVAASHATPTKELPRLNISPAADLDLGGGPEMVLKENAATTTTTTTRTASASAATSSVGGGEGCCMMLGGIPTLKYLPMEGIVSSATALPAMSAYMAAGGGVSAAPKEKKDKKDKAKK